MERYTLSRTGQAPLVFRGEKIACVYGLWHDGIHWSRYHNVAVYRTEDDQYVISIQYRRLGGDDLLEEPPYDHAVMGPGNSDSLADEFRRYEPLGRLLRPPSDEDSNYLRLRYQEQVRTLLRLIQRVQDGERPPLYEPVVIEWGEIDDEVREAYASAGAGEGISGHEWLRRSEEETMAEVGEGGAPVIVIGAEDEDTRSAVTRPDAVPIDSCVDCGTKRPNVFFTSWELGYSLCQTCFEARQTPGGGQR